MVGLVEEKHLTAYHLTQALVHLATRRMTETLRRLQGSTGDGARSTNVNAGYIPLNHDPHPRQRNAPRTSLMQMKYRKLSMAWETWQTKAAQLQAEQKALFRAVQRMRKAKQAAAFYTWRLVFTQEKAKKLALRRGLMRMLRSTLPKALNTWRATAAVLQAQALALRRGEYDRPALPS